MYQQESRPRVTMAKRGVHQGGLGLSQREYQPPDFDDEPLPEPPQPQRLKPPVQEAFTREQVEECLQNLLDDAKSERLECLVEAINTFCLVLAAERVYGKNPPGTLTVKGWIGLLNRWEPLLGQFRSRQIFFAKSFLQEALDNSTLRLSPMASAFHELIALMEESLAVPVEHVVRKVG